MDAINHFLPRNLRSSGDVNYTMQRFEERVYDVLSEECGVFNPKRKVPKKVHPSRMVQKLRRIKRDSRRHLRTLKRERKNTDVAQRDYFKILRSYHKVQRITQKNQAVTKGVQEGSLTFSKAVADTHFKESCSGLNRDYVYIAQDVMARPDPPTTPLTVIFQVIRISQDSVGASAINRLLDAMAFLIKFTSCAPRCV